MGLVGCEHGPSENLCWMHTPCFCCAVGWSFETTVFQDIYNWKTNLNSAVSAFCNTFISYCRLLAYLASFGKEDRQVGE